MIWLARLSMLFAGLAAFVAWHWGFAMWPVDRDAEPVTAAEGRVSFNRTVAWFKANEAAVLTDGNAALWWMVQIAAERGKEPYLARLVQESTRRNYPDGSTALAWKRMIEPHADVSFNSVDVSGLVDYQRLLFHAVTCQPVAIEPSGDTRLFLTESMCRPRLSKGWPRDPACESHQVMALALFKRTGCALPPEAVGLSDRLLDDLAWQLRHDVIVRDPYIQRVLMLMWSGGRGKVKPIWLRRALTAQQADGGWSGAAHYLFWPDSIRLKLGQWWPSQFAAPVQSVDLHASAQGLLLAALVMTEAVAPTPVVAGP